MLERGYAKSIDGLGASINVPELHLLARQFLHAQVHPDSDPDDIPPERLPSFDHRHINVFHSALILFHAPSDPSGMKGMRREYIRSTPSWRSDGKRRDCVLVTTDSSERGMRRFTVARVLLFFSFKRHGNYYPCALVHWFPCVGDHPDDDTGMWIVRPEFHAGRGRRPVLQIIHTDSIHRMAHLLPIFGSAPVPDHLQFTHTLDAFESYYVSKWADHNSHDMLYEH